MFSFAWPWVFLILPLYWLVKYYFPQSQQNETPLRVPFLPRIEKLNQQPESALTHFNVKEILCLLTWTLFVTACANPQWLGDILPMTQNGRNIMLAIDLSPSMSIPDLQRNNQNINRLQTVKSVAAPFIEKRVGDKLGLILFASKAYLQTPLTFDRKTVGHMLADASIGLAGEQTAIGDAIALAIKKLSHEDIKSRILILLTDGGNNSGVIDPIEAAKIAKENHIKIYSIGIGASELMIRGFFGNQRVNPSADLDEKLLKQISDMTQGQYFRAQDDATLSTILEVINGLEPVSSESKIVKPVTSLFYWPLGFGLLLLSLLIFPYLNRMPS